MIKSYPVSIGVHESGLKIRIIQHDTHWDARTSKGPSENLSGDVLNREFTTEANQSVMISPDGLTCIVNGDINLALETPIFPPSYTLPE